MRKLIIAIPIMFLLLWNINAAVPHLINYYGKLTDKEGNPINDVSKEVTFRIYDAEAGQGEMAPWEETHQVYVQGGVFSVILGSITPLNLPFDKPYYLEMQIGGEVMSPRQQLTSVGYAMRAKEADSLSKDVLLVCKGSCPVGYKRIAELDGKFLVGGENYNASAGGSNTHTHGVGSYKGPSHHHHTRATNTGWGTQGGRYGSLGVASPNLTAAVTKDLATTESGTDLITGSSAPADSRPEFATVVLCEKE